MDSPAPPRHPGPPLLLLLAAWLGLATAVAAQTAAPLPPPDTLKRLSVEQLMDLVVTSVSKRPEKLAAAPAAIQVVSGDDIRRAGASSLPEALRLATNLEVAQIDARQWAITARGFNNVFADKMLVLIDGRSVYTPLYAGVYWDVQDTMLADVDRIEVISGPGATQWGANAVNGVINLTTRSARDTQGGLFVAGAGSALRGAAELRYGGVLGRDLYVRVYGKSFERDDSLRSNGQPAGDAWRAHQAGFRADWERPDRTVTIQGDLYRATMDQPGPGKIHADGGNLLGRWVRQFSTDSDLKLQVYYDRTHRRMPGSFEQTLNTTDIDLQHRLPLAPGHDFLWGGGYRVVADDIVNTPANAFLPAQVTRESFNAFVQDEITLQPDRLHVTVGTKLEHNDYTGFEFQPSVRLAWTPTRQQTLWAAVSRAVRTPSRIDRDLFSPAAPPYHIAGGGAGVVSEKLLAYELGWRAQPDPRLALSVATFVNVYDDLRSLEPLNPPQAFPVQSSSGLRGRSSGAELTADWQATARWRIRAGWTELRVHSEPQPGTLDRGTRDSIARDPNHQFFLRSSFDLSARWEFDAAVRCVSRIGQAAVPGYTEADARLGWRPSTAWEFSLLGQNLLHARHAEFNAPGARRQLSRSVLAKATWSF